MSLPRLLFALALVSSASAQPSAADTALVDRVLAALEYDLEAVGSDDGLEVSAIVRDAFFEHLEVELLAEALAVLEGDAYRRVRALPGAVALRDDKPPPADSALVTDFIVAQYHAREPADVRREVIEDARQTLPPSARAALDSLDVWEGLIHGIGLRDAGQEDAYLSDMAASARYNMGSVPPADLEAVTAYYRSDAGRYVGRREALGASRAIFPPMIETIARIIATAPDE